MYQPKESTRGIGTPPSTGSSSQKGPSKYSMMISVNTTEVDDAMVKLEKACEKAKELKELLKEIAQVENVTTVKADDIAEQIKAYHATAKRYGVVIH